MTDGSVRPTNAVLAAEVGQLIELRVDSDSVGEIHVDADRDHTFAVAPQPDQHFDFRVNDPGTVEVTTRDRAVTVATIDVA